MYQDLYDMCKNVEEVMHMFSKDLQEYDHNTVLYMIDELQDSVDAQKVTIKEQQAALDSKDAEIASLQARVKELESKTGNSKS